MPTRKLSTSVEAPTVTVSPAVAVSPSAVGSLATTTPDAATVVPSPSKGTPDDNPPHEDDLVEEARTAVAREIGVGLGLVTVAGVLLVEWGDTSLGCPEEGMSYAEVITPGYLITIAAGGKIYEYHADRNGTLISCPSPEPPASVAR